MFFINKKKKKEDENIKNENTDVIQGIIDGGISAENAVIVYILKEALNNNIELCYSASTQTTFLTFRNEKLKNFLREWFTILKLHQNNQLSNNMYEIFIKAQLSANHSDKMQISEEKNRLENEQTDENELDLFPDIFG